VKWPTKKDDEFCRTTMTKSSTLNLASAADGAEVVGKGMAHSDEALWSLEGEFGAMFVSAYTLLLQLTSI
jgi:hypothetical protein